jgi:thiol-disulfide isomerase/thioredoxin
MRRALLIIAWCTGICASCPAEDRDASDQGAVLNLANGSFVPGRLLESKDPKLLRWRSPFFTRPLEFPLKAVKAVRSKSTAPQPQVLGEYCFEVANDDILTGNLLALSDDELEIESVRTGRVHLRRDQVRRIYRSAGPDLIYLGPNGLAGWQEPSSTPKWIDEGGRLSTDQPRTSIFADLGIPEKAAIEFELSWKREPDFTMALGVKQQDQATPVAFRFEVWAGELVVIGESGRDIDLAAVQRLGSGEGFVRVQCYLDRKQNRMIVLSHGGKPVADLKIKPGKPPYATGVRITNKSGDLKLEHLRISRWNGAVPHDVHEDQARLHRTDGSVVYGRLTKFDTKSKTVTLQNAESEMTVRSDEIADVFLSPSSGAIKKPADSAKGAVRLAYRDGSRFTGSLVRIEASDLTLRCPAVKEQLRLPLAGLRSLLVLGCEARPSFASAAAAGTQKPDEAGLAGELADGLRSFFELKFNARLPSASKPVAGTLELEGARLAGWLVDGTKPGDAGRLVWLPDLANNASPLATAASGRIVYRSPPPRSETRVMGQTFARDRNGRVHKLGFADGRAAPRPRRRSLHLRSGDTIPCEVISFDEKGLRFKSPISEATFVAHDKIKAVELIDTEDDPTLDDPKRDRLLTLPRMQKGSPPTHLICSTEGDFLRGRVLEMDEKQLKVEIRLETKEIPRGRVAEIIWLHPDELTPAKSGPAAAEPTPGIRVQTMNANGNRLTFMVDRANHQELSGRSEVLGRCRARLTDVDQLLFGNFIEKSASELALNSWKLHNAKEPRFVLAGSGAAAGERELSGLESPLVGLPAPSFRLDMLDGKPFNLVSHKGHVVVLEIWASWCGPCMESMPLVDGVVREFAGRSVEFFAVNLEEQAEQAKAVLQRHKLNVPVLLDQDGVVAAKYAVTAIPQTVVIDRDGKVARLFVGGGKKAADSLRSALRELAK